MNDAIIENMVLDLSHVTTEMAVVHALPAIGPHCHPLPGFTIKPTATLTMQDVGYGERTVITGTAPISGQELEASREQVVEALASMRAAAREEGGDGFILGYDPTKPERRIPSSELALGVDCMFIWNRGLGEGPVFEWSDVALVHSTEESLEIFLVDGRLVCLHADVDWWNRLG